MCSPKTSTVHSKTMSLKRSRHQMSKTTVKVMKTKSVRFAEEPMPAVVSTEVSTSGSEVAAVVTKDKDDLGWYRARELAAELQERLFQTAMTDGLSVLLKDSYEHPHVNVQEYLNAFASYTGSNDDDTWRGLELRFEFGHREERLRIRSSHVRTVLAAAAACTDKTKNWDALAQVSRQSSAASKLFAMRMGRADARAAIPVVDGNDAASEIVVELRQREEYQRTRSNRKLSITPVFPELPRIKA
jgi:hypothetical protein